MDDTNGEERVVNGRIYPLWNQFVDRKAEWIGGTLEDFGDNDAIFNLKDGDPDPELLTTKITDITLEPNGEKSAFFRIQGEDFSCGFDVTTGGLIAGEEGWITFMGYGGHQWRIKQPEGQHG